MAKTISDDSIICVLFDLFQARLEALPKDKKYTAKMYYNRAVRTNALYIKEYNKILKEETSVGLEFSGELLLLINNFIDKVQNSSLDELDILITKNQEK